MSHDDVVRADKVDGTLLVLALGANKVLLPAGDLMIDLAPSLHAPMSALARTATPHLLALSNAESVDSADKTTAATLCEVVRSWRRDDTVRVQLRGIRRMQIYQMIPGEPPRAQAVALESTQLPTLGEAITRLREVLARNAVETQLHKLSRSTVAPNETWLDQVAAALRIVPTEQLALLATTSLDDRATRLHTLAERQLTEDQSAASMSAEQRRAILRERKRELLAELGEPEDDPNDELIDRINKAALPAEVDQQARRQARRISQGGESPDAQVARTYLDWLLDMPWNTRSEEVIDVKAARAMLDEDHQGLDKVKKRIVEYLGVRKLAPNKKGPILCLVGPPGVGKTSLGRSVARTLGRKFVRVSLGGVSDEAEIRGHRRTYVGALPGRIIQALRKAGTRNPVLMLDEIDKLAGSNRGDPQAALLEVLDPEQNFSFSDHYLEVPFDLSEVMFLATANELSTISAPLRDRMEIIELPGYPTSEKRKIVETHLLPKQLAEHGVSGERVHVTSGAINAIIEGYTREAGVRNLERELAGVIRQVAVRVAEEPGYEVTVEANDIAGYLGPARFEDEVSERSNRPGVTTGLAWTPVGGVILFVEATKMPGHGKLQITGQLGDVMRESATAALSYVRANGARWGIAPEAFAENDIHLHVPDGATPKDGPSAGQALVTTLVSLFTGRPVRGDVAMTGEITLRGLVLPVGGIPTKLLAAHRAGIRRVIIPERNGKDLVELPPEVRAALDVVLVKRVEETLEVALEPASAAVYPTLPSSTGSVMHAA